jgi:hypothetical protein
MAVMWIRVMRMGMRERLMTVPVNLVFDKATRH